MSIEELIFTIVVCVLIGIPVFVVLIGLPLYHYLETKYTKKWEQDNPDKIALLKKYDKELEELEPKVRQYYNTKDAIEKLLKELDYHYDITEQKELLKKLRQDFDQLEKIKEEQSLILACRGAITNEWARYIEEKIPKWLQ